MADTSIAVIQSNWNTDVDLEKHAEAIRSAFSDLKFEAEVVVKDQKAPFKQFGEPDQAAVAANTLLRGFYTSDAWEALLYGNPSEKDDSFDAVCVVVDVNLVREKPNGSQTPIGGKVMDFGTAGTGKAAAVTEPSEKTVVHEIGHLYNAVHKEGAAFGKNISNEVKNATSLLTNYVDESCHGKSWSAVLGWEPIYSECNISRMEKYIVEMRAKRNTPNAPVVGVDLPTDPDDDGFYEDINGNGRMDYSDVVEFFYNMDSDPIVNSTPNFDYNKNGRIDADDVVKLFKEI